MEGSVGAVQGRRVTCCCGIGGDFFLLRVDLQMMRRRRLRGGRTGLLVIIVVLLLLLLRTRRRWRRGSMMVGDGGTGTVGTGMWTSKRFILRVLGRVATVESHIWSWSSAGRAVKRGKEDGGAGGIFAFSG